MKPLISYYGGKQRLVSKLLPLIPPHCIYVEPFCGGASLFFAKDVQAVINGNNYTEVLNDINHDLINLYYVAQAQGDEFLDRLKRYPYSEYWYKHFKDCHNKLDGLDKAVAFYIRIMMSFSNKIGGGFAFNKCGGNRAITYKNHIERLPKIIERLNGVYIFCRDALDIIKRFDCEDAFFYCDPPYPGTHQGHYKGYTQDDFERLIDVLSECSGQFMLSCYDNVAVPKDWERFEFSAHMSSCNKKNRCVDRKRTEVVWRKLNGSKNQKKMIQMAFI